MLGERCHYYSRAWGVQCNKSAGHVGNCQSAGDAFAPGFIPAAPTDKVREAAGALCDYLDETSGGSWLAVCDSQEEAEACANPLLRDEVVALVPKGGAR